MLFLILWILLGLWLDPVIMCWFSNGVLGFVVSLALTGILAAITEVFINVLIDRG